MVGSQVSKTSVEREPAVGPGRVERAVGLCLDQGPCDSWSHHWLVNLPAQQTNPPAPPALAARGE